MTELAHPEPPALPSRYGWGMLRKFGWFYKILGFGRFMGRVAFEDHSVEHVRGAAKRGPVVYVLYHRSTIDHLALNTVLNRRRLPLSVWAHGATSFFWQPVAAAWTDLAYRVQQFFQHGPAPDAVRSGWLANTVSQGAAATVFLKQSQTWADWVRRLEPADPIAALLDAQRMTGARIQLVPVVVVWNRAPEVKYGQVSQFLAAAPSGGILTGLANVWFRNREAFVQAGAPVDLDEFLARTEASDKDRQIKALRTVLRRYLLRESQLVRGPRLLPHADMKRIVLDNPPMRELARREAAALGESYEDVRHHMSRDFDAMAANFRFWVVRLAHVVLRPFWTTVFSGVDVSERDMERIRGAMRDGSAVLIPCHKSHFDYILLSWVFFNHNLIVPHVVAGMNLAIWPISVFLRSVGGFFIKRSFVGERVFPAVFSRYLRELIRQGYPVEFFIEGGRTRSGKLLRPRVGVLGMVLDAASLRPTGREVTLLPIALAYEQVAEEGVYARELGGESKESESVGQLVKARSVLWRRYGRVYLRVGEPIRCSPLVDAPPWSERSDREKKALLDKVGDRVIHRIGAVMVVLPTSLVALGLLAHHRRGIQQADLDARVRRFHAFLQRAGVQEAASLGRFDQAMTKALARFERDRRIRSHVHEGERIWEIVPEQRIVLDFYKNQVLHFFAAAGFVAAAARGRPKPTFTEDDLRPAFVFLLWNFRREFRFDPDRSASALLQDGLAALVDHGAIESHGDTFEVVDPVRMGEIYALFRSLFESYAHVLRSNAILLPRDVSRRDYAKIVQTHGQEVLAAGGLTRPEALSLEPLKNAIDVYAEEGILRERDGTLEDVETLRDTCLQTMSPMVD